MNIQITEFDQQTYQGKISVTEPECDYSRNISKFPLKHGAKSAGTTYQKKTETYELTVLADTPEQIRQSLEMWVREIHSQFL